MKTINTLFLLLAISGFTFLSYPQDEGDTLQTKAEDECSSDSSELFDFDFDWDKDKMDFGLKGSPTISLNYGQSKINLSSFNSDFRNTNNPELKLGYTDIRASKYSEDVLRYRFNHIFLGNFFTRVKNENSANPNIQTDMWRFGFGWASGYGYDLGKSSIIPFHSTSLAWSRVKFKDMPTNLEEAKIAERYNESFRFGSGAEAGIRFKIIPLISVDVSYERSIIFERHLFWKWAGSGIIEAASQGMLDHFIGKIGKSSPIALPIVSMILKSALSYGIYELRQEKMNWPFNSAAPLSYDQFKVGMTFNF